MTNPMWNKFKPVVIQLALFSAIGLVAWFGIRPMHVSIQSKMADIQKQAVIREYREKQLEHLPELEVQHTQIAEQSDRFNIILTKSRLVEFIETLEHLAQDEGVMIKIESRDNTFLESKITATVKKPNDAKSPPLNDGKTDEPTESTNKSAKVNKETGILSELPLKKYLRLTITISGEYLNIIQYVHRLESLPYALDIIAMDIKVQPEKMGDAAPESGTLDPFNPTPAPLVEPSVGARNVLDAALETVIYMNDESL